MSKAVPIGETGREGFLDWFFLTAPSYTTILLKDLGHGKPTDGMVSVAASHILLVG